MYGTERLLSSDCSTYRPFHLENFIHYMLLLRVQAMSMHVRLYPYSQNRASCIHVKYILDQGCGVIQEEQS